EYRCFVLAKHRRVEFELLGKFGKAQRKAGNLEFAENRIVNRPPRAALDKMRVFHGLAARKDRWYRPRVTAQRIDGGFVGGHRGQPFLNDANELEAAMGTVASARIGGILRELG